MAVTSFATDNALTKKVWEEGLFRDTVKETYFSRFMGKNSESLVHVKENLEKSQGDKITFGLRMRLTGSGVTGTATLEGNEEALTTYSDSLTLEMYRHGVRDRGALDRKRAMFSINEESIYALKDWGREKIDQLCFDALTTSPTKNFYRDGTASGAVAASSSTATAKGALRAANSKLTPDFISALKASAKTGGNRAYVPIRPVMVDGRAYYILLVHPDNMYDLKIDSGFEQAFREAEVRGPENPIFKGATAIWDGVVIHEHENVPIFTDGGAGAEAGSQGMFLGAQSLCWAFGERPEVVTETFDYGNQVGHAWSMIAKAEKPTFNSQDYGSLGVWLARTNISGI